MVCPKPSVSLGVFICLFGHLFGSSGCAADLSTQWRGQLLAAALRFGLSGLEEPSVDQLEDRLRRSLAVCIGVSASSIVRLRIVDLMTGTSGFGEDMGTKQRATQLSETQAIKDLRSCLDTGSFPTCKCVV